MDIASRYAMEQRHPKTYCEIVSELDAETDGCVEASDTKTHVRKHGESSTVPPNTTFLVRKTHAAGKEPSASDKSGCVRCIERLWRAYTKLLSRLREATDITEKLRCV